MRRRPRYLLKTVGHDLLASRELDLPLIVRDLSAQYRLKVRQRYPAPFERPHPG